MADEDRLQRMNEGVWAQIQSDPRYLRYSNAVSVLRWIIDDLAN